MGARRWKKLEGKRVDADTWSCRKAYRSFVCSLMVPEYTVLIAFGTL